MVQKVLQFILNVLKSLGIRKPVPALPTPSISSSPTPSEPLTSNPPVHPDDEKKLAELYPPFADLVRQLLKEAAKQGMQVAIFEGVRSFEKQKELYSHGRDATGRILDHSKVITDAPPGLSAHQYGLAIDLVFNGASEGKPWQWSWDDKKPWKDLADIGVKLGLDAAYYWTKFKELPHQEKVYGLGYHELLALYTHGGIDAVWEKLDQIRGE